MLQWLALNMFHSHILLAGLAFRARGHVILEQRLVCLVMAMIGSNLSTGIFMLDHLEKTLAAVQLVVFAGLVVVLVYTIATAPFVVPFPNQLRSSSFDHRRQVSVSSIAVGLQFVVSLYQTWDTTFGQGQDYYYTGDSSGAIYQSMAHTTATQMLWVTIILGSSLLLATVEQQKSLLVGEAAAMFMTLFLLAGEQGSLMSPTQMAASGFSSFFGLLIALSGSF